MWLLQAEGDRRLFLIMKCTMRIRSHERKQKMRYAHIFRQSGRLSGDQCSALDGVCVAWTSDVAWASDSASAQRRRLR